MSYISEKLKRNTESTSKKTSSAESEIKDNQNPLSIALQLLFSEVDKITFKYQGGQSHSLYNRDLRLKNKSDKLVIYFKIKCNNPQHYKVHPGAEELQPGKSIDITIQLLINSQETQWIGPKYFEKYASDKFMIQWETKRADHRNDRGTMTTINNFKGSKKKHKRIYKTFVEIAKGEEEQIRDEKETKANTILQKTNEFYQQVKVEKNKRLMNLEKEIQQKQGKIAYESILTCGCIAFFCGVSFCLGVLITL